MVFDKNVEDLRRGKVRGKERVDYPETRSTVER